MFSCPWKSIEDVETVYLGGGVGQALVSAIQDRNEFCVILDGPDQQIGLQLTRAAVHTSIFFIAMSVKLIIFDAESRFPLTTSFSTLSNWRWKGCKTGFWSTKKGSTYIGNRHSGDEGSTGRELSAQVKEKVKWKKGWCGCSELQRSYLRVLAEC